jgi:SAM-dependent methyltransferase
MCSECNYVGLEARLDQIEMNNLYSGYRGEEYNTQRLAIEPHYVDYIDRFDSPEEIERRMVGINWILDRIVDIDAINSVLDYGGGSGNLIPDKFTGKELFVHDISNEEPIPGVKKFNVESNQKFDFILCCHVLEHVAEPENLVNEILKFAHDDTLIYFEVPNFDCPPIPNGVFHEHISVFSEKSLHAFFNRMNFTFIDGVQYDDYIGFLVNKKQV